MAALVAVSIGEVRLVRRFAGWNQRAFLRYVAASRTFLSNVSGNRQNDRGHICASPSAMYRGISLVLLLARITETAPRGSRHRTDELHATGYQHGVWADRKHAAG